MAHFWQRRICWLHDLRRDDEPGATTITTFPTLAAFTTSRAAATVALAAAATSLALAATAVHIATLAAAAAALATQFATPARSSTKLAHTDGWQHVRDHQ